MENLTELQAPRSIYQVLGTLTKFPQLLLNPKMNLSENDFFHSLHKTIFRAIKDMICKDNDIKRLTEIDIDNHLSAFVELYEIWNDYNGLDYMRKAIEHSTSNTFKIHYQEVKKYSLLGEFVNAGVDVTKLLLYCETDLNKWIESRKSFEFLGLDEVEKQLIEFGKGNEDLQQQLSNKQTEIDNQIASLMKRKQELSKLKEQLI